MLCRLSWRDVILPEEVKQLSRNFIQGLFGKQVRVLFEIIERNELNDICGCVLPVKVGVESLFITVKGIHVAEISITDTNNDNAKGQFGTSDDLVDSFGHIINDTVSDKKQD